MADFGQVGTEEVGRDVEVRGQEQGDASQPIALKCENTRIKLVLYHWSQSFCSQKVRLVIAEKGLKCEEYDVNLPLSEHNEPWFMRLNPAGEVPVLIHGDNIICESAQIIDYLESKFEDENFNRSYELCGSPIQAHSVTSSSKCISFPCSCSVWPLHNPVTTLVGSRVIPLLHQIILIFNCYRLV
ncbi:ganglioside-induced differentiation-associated protein 1-like isoform X2 [Hypanus sabinus]|uniref:ganglioside-induced differentiation-associated protein 1-like isoform X2 n=1 Tax=Hypanus sabinus TaxID=79690 RepID=UPI0028C40CF5|nr:ganglioside-induced differentiation-associated protein 1-like isoform X2 [Hypanus sabinus]